jgi:hypothetical protein
MADEKWYDTWALVYNGFLHKEYLNEQDAQTELERLKREYPDHDVRIVFTENAGFGNVRFKMVGVWGIRPIGEYKCLT